MTNILLALGNGLKLESPQTPAGNRSVQMAHLYSTVQQAGVHHHHHQQQQQQHHHQRFHERDAERREASSKPAVLGAVEAQIRRHLKVGETAAVSGASLAAGLFDSHRAQFRALVGALLDGGALRRAEHRAELLELERRFSVLMSQAGQDVFACAGDSGAGVPALPPLLEPIQARGGPPLPSRAPLPATHNAQQRPQESRQSSTANAVRRNSILDVARQQGELERSQAGGGVAAPGPSLTLGERIHSRTPEAMPPSVSTERPTSPAIAGNKVSDAASIARKWGAGERGSSPSPQRTAAEAKAARERDIMLRRKRRTAGCMHCCFPCVFDWADNLAEKTAPERRTLSQRCGLALVSGVEFTSSFVIHPDADIAFWWNISVMLWVYYSAMIIPTRFGFQTKATGVTKMADYLLEAWFLVDLAFNFRLGYVDSDTLEVITDQKAIRRNYLKGWFLCDFVSSIPVEFIALGWPAASDLMFLKVMRLTKIFRLVRLLNLKAFQDMEESGKVNPAVVRLMKLVVAFMLVLHITACAYWFMVHNQCAGAFTLVDGKPTNTMQNFCPEKEDIGQVQRLEDFLDRYNEAFYWAIQVMIGNTSIRQDNTATFVFTNVMLLVGIAVFSSIIGGASALLSNLDSLAAAKKAQVDSINHYLAFRKVPTELRRKISSYVKYLWHSGLSSYHKELFEDLPDALMLQLNISLKQSLIAAVPMFQKCTPRTVLAVIHRLEPTIMLPDIHVTREGDVGDCMYFVVRGKLTAWMRNPKSLTTEVAIGSISAGAHFGELALLGVTRRTASVRTNTYCEFEVLSSSDFDDLLQTFADLRETMLEMAKQRLASERFKAAIKGVQQESIVFDENKHVVGLKKKKIDSSLTGEMHSLALTGSE